jgi:hypothetical protein
MIEKTTRQRQQYIAWRATRKRHGSPLARYGRPVPSFSARGWSAGSTAWYIRRGSEGEGEADTFRIRKNSMCLCVAVARPQKKTTSTPAARPEKDVIHVKRMWRRNKNTQICVHVEAAPFIFIRAEIFFSAYARG